MLPFDLVFFHSGPDAKTKCIAMTEILTVFSKRCGQYRSTVGNGRHLTAIPQHTAHEGNRVVKTCRTVLGNCLANSNIYIYIYIYVYI